MCLSGVHTATAHTGLWASIRVTRSFSSTPYVPLWCTYSNSTHWTMGFY